MMTPRPNPAAFDGHWLTPRDMAALLGTSAHYLAELDRIGKLPPRSVKRKGWRQPRLYDAGKVLAARQRAKEGMS